MLAAQTKKLIELALAEDLGNGGDVTSNAVISADAVGEFVFTAREDMVLCGAQVFQHIVASIDAGDGAAIQLELLHQDGDALKAGAQIAKISGNVRAILRIERVVLNFMQHLSGIATLTNTYVQEVAHTQAQVFDTRKTTPGFRELEKFAVRCGGGQNHRMRLDDMVLIKDNHIAAAGGIAAAVAKARGFVRGQGAAQILVELEVDNLAQLTEAISAAPDIIMCDNFSLADLRKAVQLVAGKIPLEASGGVNLGSIKAIAETGVARISTSKITQAAAAVDIGLDEC